MTERDLPWPPERPPTNKAVKKAWHELHREAIAHMRRIVPVANRETRAMLKILKPRELNVRIVTQEQHAEAAFGDVADDVDFRPEFDEIPNDPNAPSYDMENDEGDRDQGDLATVDVQFYSADTRFCVAMSLEWRETRAPTNPDSVEITEYEYRRISVHPDTAAYLISRLSEGHRKTIADALVFQMTSDDGEQLAEEELDDGRIAPSWRNRTNDPALDPLRICTHLQDLYFRLVAGEHTHDYMNDDPDAPKQPEGT